MKEIQKRKNKELENVDLTTIYTSGFYDGEKKWKDKIRAKIVELKSYVKSFEETDNTGRFKKEKSIDFWKLKALEELLEE